MAACGFPGEPGRPAGAQQMALAGFPDTGIQMLKSGFERRRRIAIREGRNPEPEPTAAAAIGSAGRIMFATGGDSVALAQGPPWFAIYIDAVHEFGDDLWVEVRMVDSGRHCEIPRLWTPVAAVRVPKRDGYVTWIDRLEPVDC